MIQINLIQKRLLSELYNEMPYSSKTLGNLLGVSDRTIRNEIIKLNEVLKDHGAQIAAKARTGCELEVTDRAAFSKFCTQKPEWLLTTRDSFGLLCRFEIIFLHFEPSFEMKALPLRQL